MQNFFFGKSDIFPQKNLLIQKFQPALVSHASPALLHWYKWQHKVQDNRESGPFFLLYECLKTPVPDQGSIVQTQTNTTKTDCPKELN